MSLLIENLLPRLQKFAQRTELKEALVDKIWVIYGDRDQIEYEFERNGEITVTQNGNSYDGTWKILGSGRLKINTDFTNNTLEYNFALPGLLVMKISGVENHPFFLFDPQKVINGDIASYLLKLEDQKLKLSNNNEDNVDEAMQIVVFIGFAMFIIVLIAFIASQ